MSLACLKSSALNSLGASSTGRATSKSAAIRLKETPLACFADETVDEVSALPHPQRVARPSQYLRARHPAVLILMLAFGVALVRQVVGAFLGETFDPYLLDFSALVVLVAGLCTSTFRRTKVRRHGAIEDKELGQYRLLARLGAGGMGEVFLAEHRMLKRRCAIKVIHSDRASDPKALARFEREVQLTAQLSHWNTVEIFDYGRTEDGTFFYVMEYLPGLSLEDILERHGPLAPERVVHLLRQTCQGLREAHGVGLIHRDIKPDNIFVAERGGLYDVAKLLDFGLVKPADETPSARLTQEGAISGTPLYMSPEQAQGCEEIDARSDIYSLGAVAYAMITGRPPFEGRNSLEVMIAHARDEAPPLSKLCVDVPADLERVILRCLAKRPEDRFQDTESLERALAECAAAGQWTQSHAVRWWKERPGAGATIE
jgi:serine/threonine-protein kinase